MKIYKLFTLIALFLLSNTSRAVDPSVSVYIDHISYTSARIMEFDIMVKANGSTSSLQLRTFQAGLYVNSAWVNGGALTAQNVSTYSEMGGLGYNGSFQWNAANNLINCSVNFDLIGPSTCIYTLVGTTPKIVTRVRVTNTADFSCAAAPDIRFNYVPNLSPLRLRTTFSWREVGCTTNYDMFYPGRTYGGTATFNGEAYTAGDADGKSPVLATGNTGFCSSELKISAFIEGYYDINTGLMAPNLMNCFVNHGNVDLADTVTIELHSTSNTSTIVQSFKTILRTNGDAYCLFPINSSLIGNSYWIAFRHRNTLQSWSATAVLFSTRTSYDFTSAQNSTYGSNSILLDNGKWAFYSGDISDALSATIGVQDDVIESQDYGDMENAVYITLVGYVTEDVTGDGLVESADYGQIENNVYFTRAVNRP